MIIFFETKNKPVTIVTSTASKVIHCINLQREIDSGGTPPLVVG